ncbi:MAG: hypothetical protein JXJ04_07065 [Spirochaetales bacterium]|nr:hypothetical protein [Spirochaetales bacterium]
MRKLLLVFIVFVCLCHLVSAQNIQVFSREEAMGEANLSKPRIYVQNNGPEALADFSVRYYIHPESDKIPVMEDYYTPNSEAVLLNLGNGLYAVEYDFNGTNLAPGEIVPDTSGNVVGLHYNDWGPWNKEDDPSYTGTSDFIENQDIAVFDSEGGLLYGNPPENRDISEPVQLYLDKAILNFQFDTYVPNYRGKILIVTHSDFIVAARLLEEWKLQMGYDVELRSGSEWVNYAIKEEVKAEMPDYLLLLGDIPFIPTFYVEKQNDMFQKKATDLYYACLDPNDDWIPDLAYGRIPVSVPQQAVEVVQKIIEYEKNPPVNPDFYHNFMAASYFQDIENPGPDGYADYRFAESAYKAAGYLESRGYNRNLIFTTGEEVDPQFWNNGEFSYGEEIPEELKKPGFPWDGSTGDIIRGFEDGCFLAYHHDHGFITEWIDPFFHNQDAAALTNAGLLPVVLSINCLSGSYNSSSLCEALVNNTNGGAVGAVGATWLTPLGNNDVFFDGMIDAIWPEYINRMPQTTNAQVIEHPPVTKMGYVMNQGKLRLMEIYIRDRQTREVFEFFHYMGDPSMEIWTSEPSDLGLSLPQTNFFVGYWPVFLNLSAIPCDEAVATVTMFGERLASKTITPRDGWFVFHPQYTGTAYVTVTARGYRPFTAELTITHVNGLPPDEPGDPPFPEYQPLSLNIITPGDGKELYTGMEFQISAAGYDPNNPFNDTIDENYTIKIFNQGELITMESLRASIFTLPDPGNYEILCSFTDGYTMIEDSISISVIEPPDLYVYPRLGVLEPLLPHNGIPEVSFNSELFFSFEAFDPNNPGSTDDLSIDIRYQNLLTGDMILIAEDVTEIHFRPSDYFLEYTEDIPSRLTITAINPAHQGSGAAIDFLITDYHYTLSIASCKGPEALLPGGDFSIWLIINTHDSTIINDQGATAGVYLSEDYYFDPQSDILLGGSIPLPGEMNGIFRFSLPETITIPETITPGDYYLIVVLDNQNYFYETNEEDNIHIMELRIEDPADTMPNLRINSMNCPDEIRMDYYMRDEFNINYENTGLISIHPSPEPVAFGLYISKDRLLDDGDTLIRYSQQEINDSIEPGAIIKMEWDHMFYLPSGFTPGDYYFIVKIDDTGVLEESIEVDNMHPQPVTVLPD